MLKLVTSMLVAPAPPLECLNAEIHMGSREVQNVPVKPHLVPALFDPPVRLFNIMVAAIAHPLELANRVAQAGAIHC